MKVLFFCAMSWDWNDIKDIPPKIEQWSEFHKIDFFEFRKIMADVAVDSWKSTGADVYINKSNWWNGNVGGSFHNVLNLTDEQLHLISQYDYVVPIDDDDLFSPNFVTSISQYDQNIIVWDCLIFEIFNGRLRSFKSQVVHKKLVSYFPNDIGHWREQSCAAKIHWEIASATYALNTKWLLADPKRNVCFFSHWKATSCFGDPSIGHFPHIKEIDECLGCKIIHGANVSTLNLLRPMKPIYDVEKQWKEHWPKIFCDYYKIIQDKTNKLLESNSHYGTLENK